MTTTTRVRDLMHPIVTVDENTRIREAARVMIERGIGSVIVTRDGKPYGIVTERDLVEAVVLNGVDPVRATVAEVMVVPLATVDGDATLADATRRMLEKQVRRICVSERGEVVGIISQTDIVHELTDLKRLAKLGML
jgi:signal-transduction protein with cAMP-binding, CBS, and nucleotidyltransferase domain